MISYGPVKELVGGAIIALILGGLMFRSRYFHNLPIWTFMSFAAFIAIVSGLVKPNDVEDYVNWNVILFLIGVFNIGALAEESGLLEYVTYYVVYKVRDRVRLIIVLTIVLGVMAAIVVNDAVAAMGSLIIVPLAKVIGVDPELAILMLAFAVTIGSTMTPLGNPQNMLIAVSSGVQAPLSTFVIYLAVPTVVNLAVTGYILAKIYGVKGGPVKLPYRIPEEAIRNRRDALLAVLSLLVIIVALTVNDLLELMRKPAITEIGIIPFTVAAATFILSSDPRETVRRVNWGNTFLHSDVHSYGWRLELRHTYIPLQVPAARRREPT
ncbi:SLC13 family permease [Acidilobus sp.]|uniref:SLC13 family permease n=1 Tax=Acidilobus sp. TaxID=1872109 RepID=UPI003D0030E9